MNRKAVIRVLTKKHEKFVESIKDKEIQKLIKNNSIITGGSIVSLLLNESVKDYDYYFTDKETCEKVAKYFVEEFNKLHSNRTYLTTTKLNKPEVQVEGDRVKIVVPSAGIASEGETPVYQYFESLPDEAGENFVEKAVTAADETDSKPMEEIEKEPFRPIFMSANAITLSNKVQLVIRFYGNPEEIHKNYDFIHATNYWTSKDNKITLHPQALESILTKQLWYQGSIYPVCSIIRVRKFLKQGWYINAGQLLKMMFQISELNLSDISVLEEQLTGVDAAYFFQVIEYCKKRQEEDKDFKITTPYLVSIIDKIF